MVQDLFFVLLLLLIQCNAVIHAQNMTTNQTASNESDTTIKNDDHFETTTIDQQLPSSLLCEKRDKPYFLPHKSDLSKFYVCVKGHLFLLNCPSDYRFDSKADQCVRQIVPVVIVTKPEEPVLIAHETNCGWYYVIRAETTGEHVLNSCPMPQLFDIPTLQCQNYTEVKCKDRFEPKDACDYQIRSGPHAYPCSYLPSCKNHSNGFYPDRLRDCRMYFRCTSERSSESYSCVQDTLPLGERFSFEEQRCVPAQYVQCTNDEQKPFF